MEWIVGCLIFKILCRMAVLSQFVKIEDSGPGKKGQLSLVIILPLSDTEYGWMQHIQEDSKNANKEQNCKLKTWFTPGNNDKLNKY